CRVTRHLGAGFYFLGNDFGPALGVGPDLNRVKKPRPPAITAVDERVAVAVDLVAVAHVDHDVTPRREARQQTPGRVDQPEEFGRGAHVPDLGDLHRHDRALVQPELLVGHGSDLLRDRRLLDDTAVR